MSRRDWQDVEWAGISLLLIVFAVSMLFRIIHAPNAPATTGLDGMTCEVLYLIDGEQVTLCREGSKDAR